jgi:hypothetical protein
MQAGSNRSIRETETETEKSQSRKDRKNNSITGYVRSIDRKRTLVRVRNAL